LSFSASENSALPLSVMRCHQAAIRPLHLSDQRSHHSKTRADCRTFDRRLDPMNGPLLTALSDTAFEQHLISFSDGGRYQTRT
jgi:hypothetical protein